MPQQRILGPRVPRSDGKILHRQKRGWMWNQFFLLEEYTGSDYQYVGKVSQYGNDKYLHSFLVFLSKSNLFKGYQDHHSFKFEPPNIPEAKFVFVIQSII